MLGRLPSHHQVPNSSPPSTCSVVYFEDTVVIHPGTMCCKVVGCTSIDAQPLGAIEMHPWRCRDRGREVRGHLFLPDSALPSLKTHQKPSLKNKKTKKYLCICYRLEYFFNLLLLEIVKSSNPLLSKVSWI